MLHQLSMNGTANFTESLRHETVSLATCMFEDLLVNVGHANVFTDTFETSRLTLFDSCFICCILEFSTDLQCKLSAPEALLPVLVCVIFGRNPRTQDIDSESCGMEDFRSQIPRACTHAVRHVGEFRRILDTTVTHLAGHLITLFFSIQTAALFSCCCRNVAQQSSDI